MEEIKEEKTKEKKKKKGVVLVVLLILLLLIVIGVCLGIIYKITTTERMSWRSAVFSRERRRRRSVRS